MSVTRRQREVWRLIAEGQNTKTIAAVLKLSPKTVEYHRAELMRQTGIYDTAGLTREAIFREVIQTPRYIGPKRRIELAWSRYRHFLNISQTFYNRSIALALSHP